MQIEEVLPHREPFLFVDEIDKVEYMKFASGKKTVRSDELWIPGHFPGNPVFPGVLILETMAQIGGFVFCGEDHSGKPKFAYLSKVNNLKLKRKVVPGDTLCVEVTLMENFLNYSLVKAFAKVGEKKVAEAEIVYTFLESL